MTERTARLTLPLIAAGQSQKEVTHNEMVALVDVLAQAVVMGRSATPPVAPQPGQCWAVAADAGGDWQAREGAIAQWSANGWLFVPGFEGLAVWSLADARTLRLRAGVWTDAADVGALRIGGRQVVGAQQPPIRDPAGGSVVDTSSRTAISAILVILRAHGLISN